MFFFNASLSKLVWDFVSLGFFAQDFFWIISKFRSEWMSQSVSQSVRDIQRYRAPPEEELKIKNIKKIFLNIYIYIYIYIYIMILYY